MMLDLQAAADVLYGTKSQDAPVVPPGDAQATTATTATKTLEQQAAEAARHEQSADDDYTLALPEDALLEVSAIERTTAFARAAGLSPEVAQQALEHANAEVAAYRDGQMKTFEKLTRDTWVTEAKRDPEIGGEKFTGSVTAAKQFLKEFGDEEVSKILDDTGWGNNRHVIRMLSRAMKRMPGASGGSDAIPKSDADVLYGKTSRS